MSSPFQSAGSWKGNQIPQRRHCKKAARDVEVADSCVVKKGKRIEDGQTLTGLLFSYKQTTLINLFKTQKYVFFEKQNYNTGRIVTRSIQNNAFLLLVCMSEYDFKRTFTLMRVLSSNKSNLRRYNSPIRHM